MSDRINKLCDKNNIKKSSKYPVNINTILCRDKDIPLHDNIKEYRSLVMSVRYIAMLVKPELLCVASLLACKQNAPSVYDYDNALQMLEYLLGVKDEYMILKGIGKGIIIIRVYTDAAFRVHIDNASHGGTAVFIGGSNCAVFCTSGKINIQCRSSTDAELVELECGTYLGDYYQQVLTELGYECHIIYMQDNDSCSTLVEQECHDYDRKRKAIVSCINSIYSNVTDTDAEVMAVLTILQHADILSKPMVGKLWGTHKGVLRGVA
jgi:hypothetical protein